MIIFQTIIFWKNFFNDSEENNISISEKSENNESYTSLLEFIIDTLKLNLSETLAKQKRIKLLKKIFGFISGMSYSNSLFTALINLLSDNPDYPNYKFSLKYSFIIFSILVLALFYLVCL